MKISDFREKIDKMKGRRDQVQSDLEKAQVDVIRWTQDVKDSEDAQRIIQYVAKQTQQQLEFRVSAPVSAALAGIWDNPYEFALRFVEKRGQTEANLIFSRAGVEYKDLIFSGGGGEVDAAAFGLQIAAWSMGKTRPFLLCDEPLKFLKSRNGVYEERGAMMIKEISKELGLQILMISHIPQQQKGSDRVFDLKLNNDGVTQVKIL